MTPLLESFGPDEWAVIAIGCVAVIVVPAIVIGGIATAAEWPLRFIKRRLADARAAITESATIPTAPAAASVADIDQEWADIESAIRGSK